MSKKSQPTPTRQLPWLWLVSGAAVLLIAAGLVLWRSSASPSPQTGGSDAHLVVDKTTIDEGKVKLGTPIRTTFRLSNTGSQPLQILGEPKVELIEGCWPPRAVVSSTTINPREEVLLTMDYMMHAGMDGPHEFHVRLHTNDPVEPEKVLIAKSNWIP